MYLGIDLGTSGIKALLIDADQKAVAAGHAKLDVSRPHPGWSEQDPAHWIRAAEEAIAELKASHPRELAAVKGIGLSGHMHGATLIDKSDARCFAPACCGTTRAAMPRRRRSMPIRASAGLTGNIVFPGFTAPKVEWVKKNEPAVFASVAQVLLPKDYLRLWLTGEYISDMSDSAGTSWLDIGRRRWSAELLDATDARRKQMPSWSRERRRQARCG